MVPADHENRVEWAWRRAVEACERFGLGSPKVRSESPSTPSFAELRLRVNQGRPRQALQLAADLLADANRLPFGELVGIFGLEAIALIMQGSHARAEQAIVTHGQLTEKDPRGQVVTQELWAYWHLRQGRWGNGHFEEALQRFQQVESAYRGLGDWEGVVRSINGRGWAEGGRGSYYTCLETVVQGLEVAQEHDAGEAIHRLALLAALIGKDGGYEQFGLRSLPEAIRYCTHAEDCFYHCRALIGYADVLGHRRARSPQAIPHLRSAIEISADAGLFTTELEARAALVHLYSVTQHADLAQAEQVELERRADRDLGGTYTVNIWRNEVERAQLYEQKLERLIVRLRHTLDATNDAILIFEPRHGPNGEVVDFVCDTGNLAAFRTLCPTGQSVQLLSDFGEYGPMANIEPLMRRCLEAKEDQEDQVSATLEGEERHYVRRVLFLAHGVSVCLEDVTDQLRWERQIEAAMQKTVEESQRLEKQTQALMEANRRLDRLAVTDGLTEVHNHRAFQDRLEQEFWRAKTEELGLSCILLDVDHFKLLNDEHGHQAGDLVLKGVAKVVKNLARSTDFVARYGGEEFGVILPGAGVQAALNAAERIRTAIANQRWRYKVTISLGVATLQPSDLSKEGLIARADLALYAAKRAGRNCVVHADNSDAQREAA